MLALLRLRAVLSLWFLLFLLAVAVTHGLGLTDRAYDLGRWLRGR